MKRLFDRRRRVGRKLPPLEEVLRGTVLVRFLRCGKSGCHCAEGQGHRAIYLSVTLPGGRTEQISLRAELVPVVEKWVSNYHAWWAAIEKVSAINREVIRHLREQRSARAPPRRRHPR